MAKKKCCIKRKEPKGTSVPTLLCIFFVVFLGIISTVLICFLPNKIGQYYINKNIIENGKIVEAQFDAAHKNGTGHETWNYILEFRYQDENGFNYYIMIKANQSTDVDALKGKTIKIRIDGKGNCLREETKMGDISKDVLLYSLVCSLFVCALIPFIVILILNFRYFVYQCKSKSKNIEK